MLLPFVWVKDKDSKSETQTPDLVQIVNKFLESFLEDTRISSKAENSVQNSLLEDTQPIWIPPYKMDPIEFKDLKE